MEMNALMQALVKDLAEQMKPLIAEQIATWAKDNLLVSLARMEDNLDEKITEYFSDNLRDGIIENLDDSLLGLIVEKIEFVRRARGGAEHTPDIELTDIQLRTIASNIHMVDLAGELFDGQLAAVAVNLSKGQLETIANAVNLSELANAIDSGDLAREIDLEDLAGEIDLEDLAKQIDTDELSTGFDMSEPIKEFFENNTFTLRP